MKYGLSWALAFMLLYGNFMEKLGFVSVCEYVWSQ